MDILIAGGAGFIWGRINVGRNAMRRPDQPLVVPTRATPREVMTTAARGFQQCFIWSVVFVAFWLVIIYGLYRVMFGS